MNAERNYAELECSFRQVYRKMQAEWNKQTDRELTNSHVIILENLALSSPQKVSSLIDTLHVTAGAITGLVDKLIDGGYARRERAENDRRVVYLEITDQGRERLAAYRIDKMRLLALFFQDISDEDINHLIRIYKQILNNTEIKEM